MNTAIITLKDFTESRHAVVIPRCKSQSDANTIADFIASKSEAIVLSVQFIQETLREEGNPGQGTAYDCVAQRLKFWFHDDENEQIYFEIPAPKESLLTEQQTPTATIKTEVTNLLSGTTSTENLYYINGGLLSFD